jgi:PGF-pre-PGF domain-containing protein
MASRNIVTWAVLFLIALSTVAAIEDFTASGTSRILAFACSPAEGQIIVSNSGDVPSSYELVAEGKAKDWVLFVPEAFTLLPGQSQVVQEFFAIPCDATDEFLDVVISTAELELVLTQDIIVQTANNLELIPKTFSQSVLPCDPAEFSFVLHNPADFAETYSLKVLGAPEQTTISEQSITLVPGSNETIAVTVRPKDCTLSGEFAPVLVVKTEKSKIQAEIEMFLRINDTDIPEIAKGIETIRAGFAPQEAGFDIFNKGDRITTYLLRVDGANFVSVQPEQVTIDPRDSETVKLILQPTASTPAGTYQLTLTARVEATGKEYTKSFAIKLGPKTFFEKLFAEYLPFTIAGIVLLIILIILVRAGIKKWKSPEFQAKLAERRAERERRRQERLALKEARRKEREEEKKRKEELKRLEEEREQKEAEKRERELERERLNAQKEYDKQLRHENLVIPKDSIIAGFKVRGKRLLKLALLALILILIGFGLTFQQALAQNADAFLTGLIVLLATLVLHRIRRGRRARGRWKLALANKVLLLNTKWRKGLTEISFKLNNVVEKLVVVAKRCRPTVPSPSEHTYQTFVITPNVENDQFAETRLKFRIRKSWLMRHRIPPSAVRLLQLNNDRWQSIVAEVVSTDAKHVYYAADIDGFGEFAIVGKPGKQVQKPHEFAYGRMFGVAVFVIAAILAIISLIVLLPTGTQQAPVIGIPAQVWTQDTQHVLDLGKYFKDPDNDPMAFSATRTENIDIQFIDSKAVMTPRRGWSGSERTVFIADDGKAGGIVKSNPVELIVEKTLIPAGWKRAAGPVLIIAVIALILLGLVLFRKRIKKAIGLEE